MSRTDLAIGIALGLTIGIVALILFVFLGSSETIDDPSIDATSSTEQPSQEAAP